MKKTLLTLAAASALSVSAQAEQFWADNSVSYLYGTTYNEPFGDELAYSTVTLEHVSGHSWGGLFYFMDHNIGSESGDSTYFEFAPRYSLMKMDGMVNEVSLEYAMESGTGTTNNLFGASVGLSIPGMNYAGLTLYYAMNDGQDTNDMQLTGIYGWSSGKINVDGFFDLEFAKEDNAGETNLHFNPQITYDIADMVGSKSKFKVGIEYSYWSNQYGLDGEDQSAISLLLKAHL